MKENKKTFFIVYSILVLSFVFGLFFNNNLKNVKADDVDYLCITTIEESNEIKLSKKGTPSAVNLEYSLDLSTWNPYTWESDVALVITLANIGDKVYFRAGEEGNSSFSQSLSAYYYFESTGKFNASGDVTTIINQDGVLDLSATSYNYCFAKLFSNSKIVETPVIKAVKLGNYTCNMMFSNCAELKKVPSSLPATTIGEYCYSQMFNGCKSLEDATMDILCTVIPNNGLSSMFLSCSSLVKGPKIWASESDKYGMQSMFSNCSVLKEVPDIECLVLGQSACTSMFSGSGIEKAPVFKVKEAGKTCFDSTFSRCASLTSVPDLNFEKVGERCCTRMFYQCTSLVKAPEIKATELSLECFVNMFDGCTALTTASSILPATTLAESCYDSMFINCKALTVPPVLPATTLAVACYESMFKGCTALVNAPELPATELVKTCYKSMFSGCTSLTKGPILAATTLAESCYSNMFTNSGIVECPELPATKLETSCYYYMFANCKDLVKCPILHATTLTSGCYYGMFSGCQSLVNAPELPAISLAKNCYYSMFSSCKALVEAPALPAVKLEESCYSSMFSYCTALTKAPELVATTLANKCYSFMFDGCTSLNSIRVAFTSTSGFTTPLNYWLRNVDTNGFKFYGPSTLSLPSGDSGMPSGATYVNALTVTINSNTGGKIKPDKYIVCENDEVTLTITFDNDHIILSSLNLDDGSQETPIESVEGVYKFTMPSSNVKVVGRFEIKKDDNEISDFSILNWEYGKTPSTPTATALFGEIVYTYASTIDGTYVEEVPTEIGTYYVKATVVEGETYSGCEEIISFDITKIIVNKPEEDKTNFIYTGSVLNYHIEANDAYIVTGCDETNPGLYEVTISLVDNIHSSWDDDTTSDLVYNFVIKAKEVTKAYDSNKQEITDPVLTIVNAENGLNPNALLIIEELNNDEVVSIIKNSDAIGENNDVIASYNALLLLDDALYNQQGKLEIKIKVPTELVGKEIKVVGIKGEEVTNLLSSSNASEYVNITIDNICSFAILTPSTATSNPGNTSNKVNPIIFVIGGVVLVAAAAVTFVIIKKKKQN